MKLALLIKELECDIEKCVNCGVCQSACPLFRETRRETDVARGKLYILKSILNGKLHNAKRINFNIEKCLLCASCKNVCPRGVDTIKIFLKTRVILSSFANLSYPKKILLRKVLPNPVVFDIFAKFALNFQKVVPKDLVKNSSKKTSFKHTSITRNKVIAFYSGCLIDKFFNNITEKLVSFFNKNGFDVVLFKDEVCCGIPSLSFGDIKSFNKLVEKNITVFKEAKKKYDFKEIVTACPTCAYTIKKLWKDFYDGKQDLKQDIEKISCEVKDINEVVFENLDKFYFTKSDDNKRELATYHDPCHLKKSLNIYKEPRLLIEKTEKYQLVEMEEADSCCGMGGTFSFKFKDISEKIAKRKKENIEKSGASTIITSCPACILQIKNSLPSKSVKHIVEII